MTVGVSVLTLWGVQRQQALRQAGAADPLAASDPQQFLVRVAAQVIHETFLFAFAACVLGLLLGLMLAENRELRTGELGTGISSELSRCSPLNWRGSSCLLALQLFKLVREKSPEYDYG